MTVLPVLVMIVIGDCKIIVNILKNKKNKKTKNADHLLRVYKSK